jgi:hypothetical protein
MKQFRASSLSKIMGYPEKDMLPDGAITEIAKIASQIILGWDDDELDVQTVKKGILCEQDSIDLFNHVFGTNYKKNKERVTTDLITGECDIITKEESRVVELKTVWSKETFPLFLDEGGGKKYEWQQRGYMHGYDVNECVLAYALVDTPIELLKPWDDINKHVVSNIKPELRLSWVSLKRDAKKEDQMIRRCQRAQMYLMELLAKKGYQF